MIRSICCLLIFIFFSCQESASTAVPKLAIKLKSKVTTERSQAALKLGSYGKYAEPATKDLIFLLRDPNGGVRSAAAYALRKIDTEEARVALDKAEKFKVDKNKDQ